MRFMSRKKLLRETDINRIHEAIEAAERLTSGEIRVSVAPFFWGSVRHAAERAFDRLGMSKTADHNGILFFVIPARRRLVLLGDSGIHEKVGQAFWDEVVSEVTAQFAAGDFTQGLVRGIQEVGERLAEHFPYSSTSDINELPNAVDLGKSKSQKQKSRT